MLRAALNGLRSFRWAVFITGLLVLFLTSRDRDTANSCFSQYSYYLTFLTYAVAIWAALKLLVVRPAAGRGDWLKIAALPCALSALLCLIVFNTVAPEMRVIGDEDDILSTSRAMYEERSGDQVLASVVRHGEWEPVIRRPSIRTLVFPFLIQLLHVLRGYSIDNGFLLNGLLLFGLLAWVGFVFSRRFGSLMGVAAVLFTASQPVLLLAATSAHYDVCFVLIYAWVLYAVYRYARDSSQASFDFLWIGLIMLVLIRHEGIVHSSVIGAALLATRCIRLEHVMRSYAVAFTPLLLLQAVWHLIDYTQETASNMKAGRWGKGVEPFTLDHFIRQNRIFLESLPRFDFRLPFNNALNIAGIVSIPYLLYRRYSDKRAFPAHLKITAAAAVAGLTAYWVFFTSWHWCAVNDAPTFRFYLLPVLALSLLAVWAAATAWGAGASGRFAVAALSVLCWLLYQPVAARNELLNSYTHWEEYHFVTDYLSRRTDREFVLIADQSNRYCLYDYGAVNFRYARENIDELFRMKQNGSGGDIILLQRFNPSDKNRKMRPAFEPRYPLKREILIERAVSRNRGVRLTLLKDGAPAAMSAPARPAATKNPEVRLTPVATVRHKQMNHPKSVYASPDGKVFYVNNLYSHNTMVIDAKTREVLRVIPFDGRACEADVSNDGRYYWVSLAALQDGDKYPPYIPEPNPGWEDYDFPSVVYVVDREKDYSAVRRIPVQVKPKIIKLSPDGKHAYVSNFNSHTVSVISTEDHRVVKTLQVGKLPRGIAFVNGGRQAYVANMRDSTLSVIDTERIEVVGSVAGAVPTPRHLVASRDGKTLYVSSAQKNGSIKKIRVSDNRVLGSAPTGRTTRSFVLSPDEKYIFAANYYSHDISVVNTQTMKEVLRMRTPELPIGVAISPDGSQLWVASFRKSVVTVYAIGRLDRSRRKS